jgi:hypothetical protein
MQVSNNPSYGSYPQSSSDRIDSDGKQVFFNTQKLLRYTNVSSDKYTYECITEFEGKLIVLEEIFEKRGLKSYCVLGKTPLNDLIWKAAGEAYHPSDAEEISLLLNHKGFTEYLQDFMLYALSQDASGVPRVFSCPKDAILESKRQM